VQSTLGPTEGGAPCARRELPFRGWQVIDTKPWSVGFASCLLVLAGIPVSSERASAAETGSPEVYAQLPAADLDALVAPIALYPDALVAQVLGAATYPDQVVERTSSSE
jgi:Protein of unknown function (DUF3300)